MAAKKKAAKKGNGLTPRQARFVEEYLVDLNATKAAERAGYSKKTANEQGARLLANVSVAAAVFAGKAARSERTKITADTVLEELMLILKSDVLHYSQSDSGGLDLVDGAPEGAQRAVSSMKRKIRIDQDGNEHVETEIKLWDKPSTLRMAMQHLGILVEKHEHKHDISEEVKAAAEAFTSDVAGLSERLRKKGVAR